jgi:flagellar biosynthetic protein FliR
VSEVQLLVLARCLGFVFRAPGFSHPDVPPLARAALAYVLSGALATRASTAHLVPGGLAFAVASELALGAAIGTAASLLYDGAYAGGRALDDYAGIRGSVPTANVAAGAGFGRLWSLAFATGFFVLGGDRLALAAFAGGFDALPPGALVAARDLATFAVTLPATLLRAALFVAGPAIVVGLVVQVALATVSRAVPRLSTFPLSFGLVLAATILVTVASLPVIISAAATPWLDLSSLRPR